MRSSENINYYSKTTKNKGSKTVKNYNIGRNEIKLDNPSTNLTKSIKTINRGENAKRVYYVLKNSDPNNSKSVRGYQNEGDDNEVSPIKKDQNIRQYSNPSNFQISRYNNKSKSISRTKNKSNSSVRSYKKTNSSSPTVKPSRSVPITRNYSRPSSSSSSSRSTGSSRGRRQ